MSGRVLHRAGLAPWVALLGSLLVLPSLAAAQGSKYGQFAPQDAYQDGSKLAYYGSENAWDRRFFNQRSADRFYKRRGQRQLMAILEGHPEQAAKWCRKRLADDPHDLESLFMLTVAQCQLKEPEKAFATMKQAVSAGLPLARFLAGPRELLLPLTSNPAFQQFAARHPVRLIHGPLLGNVTDHSARFWVRTADESLVTIRVFASQQSPSPVATAKGKTAKSRDYTAVLETTGLRPDTGYFYDVLVDGKPMPDRRRIAFRTYPTAGRPASFQIAFGGGGGYTPQHERIWNAIASRNPSALLLLGDNVYIDLPQPPGAMHRYTYYRRQSRDEFRRLVGSVPTYAIWDDHDCAIDDVWLGPYLEKPRWKLPMFHSFQENWNNPDHGGDKTPGGWFRMEIANVDFFLLDCRFYRTNPYAEKPTMLGPVQKAWLLDALRKSRAEFKVVVSSVPWASGTKPKSRDTWDGFGQEREEIFSWIEANRIDGVLLLSADRHRSDAWKIDRPRGYALYDLMSSRLTNIHTHPLFDQALLGYNEKCSFGLVTFDTTLADPEVTYRIVNLDGEVVGTLSLKKSQLTSP